MRLFSISSLALKFWKNYINLAFVGLKPSLSNRLLPKKISSPLFYSHDEQWQFGIQHRLHKKQQCWIKRIDSSMITLVKWSYCKCF